MFLLSVKRLANVVAFVIASALLTACSQSQTNNRQASAEYGIRSNIGKINYKITDELIEGNACSGTFLTIPMGATKFVGVGINTNSRVGKAKAAAVYNALYGHHFTKLRMDIIVQPQFRLETRRIPLLATETCATVIGYRAVVDTIENCMNCNGIVRYDNRIQRSRQLLR